MKLVIAENNTVVREAPAKLNLVEKRAIKANVIRRFTNESTAAGYQTCNYCKNPIHVQDSELCQPCEKMFAANREASRTAIENARFQRETKRDLKVLGLAITFGAIVIAVCVSVFEWTR